MTLQEIHDRFSDYIFKVEKEKHVMVTNHNYTLFEENENEKKEFKFKVATAFNIFKLYKQIAIIFDDFGERELFLIPEILTRYLNNEEYKNLIIEVKDPIDPSRLYTGKNMLFTGRIFIECNRITYKRETLYKHIDNLKFTYNNTPLYFSIRTTEDYENMDKTTLKNIFLCHDFNDKEIVYKVNAELSRKMYNVWFDKFSIKPGDSIFEKISEGLNKCDNGLLFISKSFLKNEGWVRFELQSLINKQVYEKKKVIIPIWLDIDLDDLKDYPWLRDKLAIKYSEEVKEFVKEIENGLI
ncbi:toll/interleukin-1 receptor domain-containing protein [Algoriphagus algorifonticola]|uniref:toll/interleukin-1 receptor domain-containing protein n=1 Tax=Algoriphagus algorifonticola TaxID=2593007 RepID=UPI0011A0DD6B|nr:toll/interleukin-1 receptor domain-containing protein [Algoriphagus algorifonticola]